MARTQRIKGASVCPVGAGLGWVGFPRLRKRNLGLSPSMPLAWGNRTVQRGQRVWDGAGRSESLLGIGGGQTPDGLTHRRAARANRV
ncbi:MAG: hypothetical protein NTV12_11060 [Verrucomicrobia bacterium]|nr:hypothetical protein [Verrucomicrobiota bacterium]